jgi:hypothetical protein
LDKTKTQKLEKKIKKASERLNSQKKI